MLIRHEALIPFPVDLVYASFLKDIDQLPPWLPGIDRIEVVRFEELSAQRAAVDYRWHVDTDIIPPLLRPFLRKVLGHLCSTTVWCAERRLVEFEFFHEDYRELFECKGRFALVGLDAASMRIDIDAELQPRPQALPGMPAWAARKSIPVIERVLTDVLRPSLLALPEALQTVTANRRPT